MDLRIQNTEETPTNVCLFDTLDPNTGGTVFDPVDLEADTDTVFVSESDASTWIYNGSAYITKTFEIPDNTPFWLYGTSLDAGGNKTAMIQRNGPIFVNSTSSNGSRYAGYFYSRVTSGQGNGMIIRKDSRTTSGNYLLVQGRNFDTGVNEDKLKVGHNGDLTINDAYTLPTTDGAVGEVLQTDGVGNVAWAASGGGSGVLGISDATGSYTYYDTFADAMTAATSGDTVEMFADIEETGDVTVTHKNGVNINGNGHTYTLNVDSTAIALYNNDVNFYGEIYNLKVVRTGRAAGTTTGYALQYGPGQPTATLKCFGVSIINDFGNGVSGRAKFYGLHVVAYNRAIQNTSGSGLYNCYGESTTNGYGIYSNTDIYDCTGVSSTGGFGMYVARAHNCIGLSTSGTAIVATAGAFNCSATSVSGAAFSGTQCYNCYGVTTSNYAFTACGVYNSVGISSSSRAYNQSVGSYTIVNSYFSSASNYVCAIGNSTRFENNTVVCNWDNAGGHAIRMNTNAGCIITNNSIRVRNSSAYCLTGSGAVTPKYSINKFEGSTTPINTALVTQVITNTSDSQGNILI